MKIERRFVAALLASVSTLGISYAYAADASMPASATEVLSVTAQDQQGAGGGSATSNVGTIDVQGAGNSVGGGYIVPEDGPKDRSTATHQGIENLLPTSNPFQAVAILPGVNQFQEDAVGLSGGTIRVRGLVASEMGFTINGVPLNDSGTFNVYPQEFIDTENVDQVWVTKGSTDVDAPHVGASGGNIGIITRAPLDYFNVKAEEAVGSDSLVREFVSLDTGWIGDFKGFASYSQANVDKWRGMGGDNRGHSDGNLLWQFLPHSSVGLTWAYNNAINNYYRDYASSSSYNVEISGQTALQTFNEIGRNADYDTFWGTSSAFPINLAGPYSTGACATHPNPACTVTNPNYPQLGGSNVSNSWGLQVNPYKNVVANVPLNVQLTDNLRWNTNGYIWYGTGGAGFGTNEEEGYCCTNGFVLAGQYGTATASQDEILTYEDTTNHTFRPGVTTKFVYDMDNWTFAAGGWIERSRLAQEEQFGTVTPSLQPCDTWMNDNHASNPCVIQGTSAFGTGPAYAYRYIANTVGKSAFTEAQGRFFDDSLKVTAGVSDRAITRSIYNQNPICADDPNLTYSTPVAASQTASTKCSAYATSTAFLESAGFPLFGGVYGNTSTYLPAYQAMQRFAANPHVGASFLLPEVNATYDIDPFQQVFASLSTGFRAPSASNYTTFTSGGTATSSNIMKLTDVKSEYAYSWEAGYRYHGDFVTASTNAFYQDVRDYQASVQLDPADFITSNIGTVKIYGIDAEAGTRPWYGFTFYGSAVLQNSVLSQNIQSNYTGTFPNDQIEYVYSRGKRLVDTPNWIVSASIGYQENGFFGNMTPHCYGNRATALNNDETIPSKCTVDASFGYRFGETWGYMKGATLQFYAVNLFDAHYLGEVYTQGQTNAKPASGYEINNATHVVTPITNISSESYSAAPGAPLFVGVRLSVNLGY